MSAFTLGQIAGVVAARLATGIGAAPAEIVFAVAVVVLARQVLEPVDRRRRLWVLSAVAGLAHGLGIAALLAGALGDDADGLFGQLFAVLGMDAAHVVGGFVLATLWTFVAGRPAVVQMRRAILYSAGAVGMALAVTLAVEGVLDDAVAVAPLQVPAGSAASPTAGVAGSRRIAPTAPNAPVQSFLAVEPFEVRHEVMLRLAGLTEQLGLDAESTIELPSQRAMSERLATWILASTSVRIDGESPEAMVRRVDFMTVDPTGALPRPNPVPEAVSDAVVGVVVAYPTVGMPREVSFSWKQFPTAITTVPTTVIDPETVTSRTLSEAEPSLTWENTLSEDPIPTVAAVEVEPDTLPLPWLSLPLFIVFVILMFAAMRGRRSVVSFAAARVVLALAFVVGPLVQTAVTLPESASRTPSERQARRILAGLLPNIYRAMEFRDEATIFDRLEVSLTGETLTEVYLEQRQALMVEERGGAQARVEAVEVLEATDIESRDGGFGVRVEWTIGGMVTHFGHRHFRQNRYNAWFEVVPLAGTWKIHSIEILEQERIK